MDMKEYISTVEARFMFRRVERHKIWGAMNPIIDQVDQHLSDLMAPVAEWSGKESAIDRISTIINYSAEAVIVKYKLTNTSVPDPLILEVKFGMRRLGFEDAEYMHLPPNQALLDVLTRRVCDHFIPPPIEDFLEGGSA